MLAAAPGGKNRLYFACIGGVYTALFILPFFYLLSTLKGKPFPREVVLISHIIVYTIAISCIAFYFIFLPGSMDYSTSRTILTIMGVLTFASLSIVALFYRWIPFDRLPHYIHVVPFVALYVNIITVWYIFFRAEIQPHLQDPHRAPCEHLAVFDVNGGEHGRCNLLPFVRHQSSGPLDNPWVGLGSLCGCHLDAKGAAART